MNFEMIAQELVYVLDTEIHQQLQTLTALNAFYLSSEKVSYQEFKQFTSPFLQKNKLIKALTFAPKVYYKDKEAIENELEKEAHLKEFEFTEIGENGVIQAVKKRDFYYPVYRIEPLISNELAWGFDLFSEENRRNAILTSLEQRKNIASKPVRLVQNVTKDSYGILVIEPVFKNGKEIGIVTIVYDIEQLFRKQLIHYEIDQLDIYLSVNNQLIYKNTNDTISKKDFVVNKKIQFTNQEWSIDLVPNKLFSTTEYTVVPFVVISLIILLGIGVFVIVYSDFLAKHITEQKVEEKTRELKLSNQELEQFAYITSHDLQEPLYTLKSYVGLFQDLYQTQIDEQGLTFLQFAVDSANRMQQMLHELLIFSSLGRQKEFREIDTNLLLKLVLEDFSKTFKEKEQDIEVVCEDFPNLYGDFIEVKKLFTYILDNSLKFRDKKRKLSIRIFSEEYSSKFVKISIQDNGIGIEKEHFDRVFIIFQRLHTRNQYQGNGIGLALCKKIVSLHGGEIFLTSEINQGTTISFLLPII